jgi:glycosyltransferase involved in cell wall biosynthesis
MRIAILTNAFPPAAKGGAGRIAALQVEALKEQGHDVRVWMVDAPLQKMNPFARLWFHLVTDARAHTDLVDEIIAWKPDELQTHNLTGCGIGTPKTIQSHGIPWTHTLHDIQLTDPSGQETETWSKTVLAKIWRAFWSARRRASFGTPDILVSPTKWLLDWHHRHHFRGKQEKVVRNPVPKTEKRDRTLHLPATVLYVGRLSRDKGFDRFLEIVKQLPPTLVNQITVNGVGPMLTDIKRLNDPRIDVIGAIPPETVQELMANADLLIAPSRLLENQQNILLEAMSVGTPIVATDTGGTRETLEGTGCPVVAPERLKDEAMRLLSDADAWKEISEKISQRAISSRI